MNRSEWLLVMVKLLLLLIVAKQHDQIRAAVIHGQRPDLSVINGPETLKNFALDCMKLCWSQNPDMRPAFAGISHKLLIIIIY